MTLQALKKLGRGEKMKSWLGRSSLNLGCAGGREKGRRLVKLRKFGSGLRGAGKTLI